MTTETQHHYKNCSRQKSFKRDMTSLNAIFEFINAFVQQNGIQEGTAYVVNLAVEEIFTNIVKYNPNGVNEIPISLLIEKNRFEVNLTDDNTNLFDPTKTPEVDINQPLQNRKPGGLGIHLVKKMLDEIIYNYNNKQCSITLIKNLEM